MTLAVAPNPPAPPGVGTIIYLASYLLKTRLTAETTPPDTPNLYGAKIEVQGDQGDMDLDPLMGPQGFPGKAQFPLRRQDPPPIVNNTDDLTELIQPNLTNTTEDIGKYWEIDTIVDGVVTARKCHVWYGTAFRVFQMGSVGIPGALPELQVDVVDIPNTAQAVFPDTVSYVETEGGRLQPSWRFHLNVPAGIPGPIGPVGGMPDVDIVAPGVPASGDIFACTGRVDEFGRAIWGPLSPGQFATQFFSVPESSFSAYGPGFDQRAAIGSFTIPAMPFQYTPIVWGHLGAAGLTYSGGIPILFSPAASGLTGNPLMVGAEVWLGEPDTGTLISRGLGNTLGNVSIMPHYSTSATPAANISATNRVGLVAPGVAATITFNLWNEGVLGIYSFNPKNAQLMILVQPMERGVTIAPFDD